MTFSPFLAFTAFSIAAVMATTARSDGRDAKQEETGWSYELTLGYEREPAYVGSDTYTNDPAFGLAATYISAGGLAWTLSTGGLGLEMPAGQDATVEFTLEYEPGRENKDDPILKHFADVRDTWEAQVVYTRAFGPWGVGLGLQTDILGRGKGTVGFVGGRYATALSDRLGFKAGLDFSFADGEHMNTEVGISSSISRASGLKAYNASGGYKGATLSLGLDYTLTERTTLYAEASVESYGSRIADSPLVAAEGNSTNTEVGVGVQFRF